MSPTPVLQVVAVLIDGATMFAVRGLQSFTMTKFGDDSDDSYSSHDLLASKAKDLHSNWTRFSIAGHLSATEFLEATLLAP